MIYKLIRFHYKVYLPGPQTCSTNQGIVNEKKIPESAFKNTMNNELKIILSKVEYYCLSDFLMYL